MESVKIKQREITVYTDKETGEVLDITKKEIKILVDTDEFCLVYTGLWNVILDNPLSKSDIELFAYLVQNYSDGTPFTINSYIKEIVSKRSKKEISSYNNSTRALIKNELLIAVASKTYKINPRYAFKGSSKDRHQAVVNMITNN